MSIFAVGTKMEFTDEPGAVYEVRASSDRFAVMTRPATQEDMDEFEIEGSPEGQVVYSLVEIDNLWRGPDHWIFGKYDYNNDEGCRTCLEELESGVWSLRDLSQETSGVQNV